MSLETVCDICGYALGHHGSQDNSCPVDPHAPVGEKEWRETKFSSVAEPNALRDAMAIREKYESLMSFLYEGRGNE